MEPAFGSIAMESAFASGLGVSSSVVTANDPAASTGASGSATTGVPAMNIPSNLVSGSNGSPDATMKFAIFPCSSVPTRVSIPSIAAGFVVSAASASSGDSPWVIASASRLRNTVRSCIRCVVSATSMPASMKRFGLVGAYCHVMRSRNETLSAATGETRSGACGKSIGRMSGIFVARESATISDWARNSSPLPSTESGVRGEQSPTSRTRRANSSSSLASTMMPCVPASIGCKASRAFISSRGNASLLFASRQTVRHAASWNVWRMSAYDPIKLAG